MRNGKQLFSLLPDIPSGTVELPPHISIIAPCGEDRTNQVTNPSFETATTSWSAVGGTIARSTTYSWAGAYSLQVSDTGSASAGATYSNVTVVSGNIYAASFYVYFPLGNISFTVTIAGTTKTVKSTGMWQRVVVIYKETASTTRTIAILCNRLNVVYYIDAVQFELCSSDKVFETTYFDGDSKSLESERLTVSPYYWTGSPHSSSSVRSNVTRSGGRVINLKDIGFQISAISGLGLSSPEIDTMEYSVLDGAQFNRQKKVNRSFTIAGRIVSSSSFQYQSFMESLHQLLDMDSSPLRNPVIVKYLPMDNDLVQTGPEVDIVAVYSGGLDGQYNNTIGSQLVISFDQQTQNILGHSRGYSLTPNASIASVAGIVRRSRDGIWSKLDTGIAYSISPTAVTIDTIWIHPDTRVILLGGLFDSAGSTSADYVVQYNPNTNLFLVFSSATTFNGRVRVIKNGLDNFIYFGGDFINADGLANADRIVRFNMTSGLFSAMGTGANAGGVYDIAFLPPESPNFGDLVAVGSFTLMGGVANTVRIAYWDGAVWTAMGTGANGDVLAVHAYYDSILGDVIIVGGNFTAVGGVANTDKIAIWHSFAWHTLGNADATVSTIIPYKNNILFTGSFNTIGGVSSQNISVWNTNSFRQITNQDLGSVDVAYVLRDQSILFGGTGISFTNYPDIVGILENGAATPLNTINPTGQINALSQYYNDDIYIGFTDSVTITTDSITSVVSIGNSKSYPIIRFVATGTQYIYGIFNYTTNQVVFFNGLFMVSGEIIIMDLDPINGYMISLLRNESVSKFMELGSTDFYITGGTNRISVFADTGITITMWWRDSFNSAIDTAGKV